MNEIWYEPSVERESLRVLRASYRRYSVRPGGAAKLAGPGTARPARRQRRVGKKIPSPPLPRNSSALPSASSRSCPCRRTSLSLSLSRLVVVLVRARSLRVCLLLASKDLRFREEKTLFCYSPFSRKYHHLQEPQDPDRELASPRVLCWGSNSSPRWQNYRSSCRRGVSGGSAAPLRPLSPPPPPPPTPALWL